MPNLFLSIDGLEIADLVEGDYTAYEQELGTSARMASGRRVEEIGATVWVVELKYSSLDADTMATLNTILKASRTYELFFLPSTGGTELVTSTFQLAALPTPKLSRWRSSTPEWADYSLRFEEVDGHA